MHAALKSLPLPFAAYVRHPIALTLHIKHDRHWLLDTLSGSLPGVHNANSFNPQQTACPPH